jgi:ketosteroid isomerase-like protein
MPEPSEATPQMLARATVDAWLAAYVEAWKSYDPVAIGNLFSEDAVYRYSPYDKPLQGRDAIVASWLEQRDLPGSYDAHYQTVMVEGDQAAARGNSKYFEGDGTSRAEFYNLFLLRFDTSGRCADYCEWYMERPKDHIG